MQGTYEHGRDSLKYPSCWRAANNTCAPHFHSSIEIVYVTDGEMNATLNGKSCTVSKNQILISPSYTVHHYKTPAYSETIVLTVPLDFIPSYNKILSQNYFAQTVFEDEAACREILHCMNLLSDDEEQGCKISRNVLKGYIYVIVGTLIDHVGLIRIGDDQKNDLAKEILIYLQNNYLSPVSLETLSKDFGYSQSRFSHIFNSNFGCTMSEYINTLRSRHAAALLTDESVSIIDAAMSSGFDSMRTFYRAFKRCFGVTPSQYRNSPSQGTDKP